MGMGSRALLSAPVCVKACSELLKLVVQYRTCTISGSRLGLNARLTELDLIDQDERITSFAGTRNTGTE